MKKPVIPHAVFGPMRLPFLLLTPVCVLLGGAAAYYADAALRGDWLLLSLAGALCAHISVNSINEYDDFTSGLDHTTTRTPFSGGSGTLPAFPEKARYALAVGTISLGITVLIGFFFLWIRGPGLLPIGLVGVLAVVLYTRWLTREPFLCLLAPGIGFGPCMVMGTDFILSGAYAPGAFAASLVPLFLVSNLLLVNQFPDIEPDAGVGRRHLMIVYGKKTGVRVYALFTAGAYLAVLAAWSGGWFPAASLVSLATAPLAVHTIAGVAKHAECSPEKLLPYMGRNVIIVIFTPALLALGLVAGRML